MTCNSLGDRNPDSSQMLWMNERGELESPPFYQKGAHELGSYPDENGFFSVCFRILDPKNPSYQGEGIDRVFRSVHSTQECPVLEPLVWLNKCGKPESPPIKGFICGGLDIDGYPYESYSLRGRTETFRTAPLNEYIIWSKGIVEEKSDQAASEPDPTPEERASSTLSPTATPFLPINFSKEKQQPQQASSKESSAPKTPLTTAGKQQAAEFLDIEPYFESNTKEKIREISPINFGAQYQLDQLSFSGKEHIEKRLQLFYSTCLYFEANRAEFRNRGLVLVHEGVRATHQYIPGKYKKADKIDEQGDYQFAHMSYLPTITALNPKTEKRYRIKYEVRLPRTIVPGGQIPETTMGVLLNICDTVPAVVNDIDSLFEKNREMRLTIIGLWNQVINGLSTKEANKQCIDSHKAVWEKIMSGFNDDSPEGEAAIKCLKGIWKGIISYEQASSKI
jgi:hypothetical protein